MKQKDQPFIDYFEEMAQYMIERYGLQLGVEKLKEEFNLTDQEISYAISKDYTLSKGICRYLKRRIVELEKQNMKNV